MVARGSVAEGGSSTCKGPEVGALGSPVEDGGEAGSSGPPKAGLDPHFASGCGSLGANLRGQLTSIITPSLQGVGTGDWGEGLGSRCPLHALHGLPRAPAGLQLRVARGEFAEDPLCARHGPKFAEHLLCARLGAKWGPAHHSLPAQHS